MRIIFDHTHGFGKMSNQSYIYAPIGAFIEQDEVKGALESGWCPLINNVWFQTRSTRIKIEEYQTEKNILKLTKNIKFYFEANFSDHKKQIFQKIYEKYITYKNFNNDYTLDDIIKNSNAHLYYTYNNKIIGFCFFKILADNMFAVEFAWDYENPKLSLGKLNIHYLCMYAKMRKYENLYMSSGYENCSIYKSNYKGFEWWTGMVWSKDVDHYRRLCYSDDRVNIQFDWQNI